MFQEYKPLFLYCVSPVHMGAGTALGAIDNPIQRERHTDHPVMAGSGLKGALRHHCASRGMDDATLRVVFGPPTTASSDHAGAVSFSDAQIVLFPVRNLERAFVYATSPTALARLKRLLEIAGVAEAKEWTVPSEPPEDMQKAKCVALDDHLLTKVGTENRLVLESFDFQPAGSPDQLRPFAQWLAEHAVPKDQKFFRDKVRRDTVLLPDSWFGHFVRNSTVVEPHVRINDESGTADDGGLFYTENLPPESLLVSMAMASKARKEKQGGSIQGELPDSAAEILAAVRKHLPGGLVQVGGDATTGRGQVFASLLAGGTEDRA